MWRMASACMPTSASIPTEKMRMPMRASSSVAPRCPAFDFVVVTIASIGRTLQAAGRHYRWRGRRGNARARIGSRHLRIAQPDVPAGPDQDAQFATVCRGERGGIDLDLRDAHRAIGIGLDNAAET